MLVAWLARTRSGVWPGILPLDRRRFVGYWFLLFSLFFGAIVPVYILTGWVGRGIHTLSKLDAPYASLVEAGLADLAAAVLVIGLYGAWLFRARPLVTRLARCLRINRQPRFWFLVFGPAVLVCTVLIGTGWLQPWTSKVFSSALMVGVWAGMRAHELGEIIRALSALPAERLAQADRGLAKFTARVAPSAGTSVGPLSQREWAAYHVKIYEVRDEHTQRGTNRTAACVRHDYRLRGVPIVDYSKPDGEGDLADSVRLVPWEVDLDVQATVATVGRLDFGKVVARVRALLHAQGLIPHQQHVAWVIEEEGMELQEPLFVVGIGEQSATERTARGNPIMFLRDRKDAPLVVHAGTESSLLAHLSRQRTFLWSLVLVSGAAVLLLGASARF